MSELFKPVLMFAGCVLGAAGVALAMPRRGLNPQIIGALVGGLGLGLMLLALLVVGPDRAPSAMFYVFSFLGLGAALRVISHPRPVYSALYFVMTILSSAGLYLLLAAEFMAFALIIVYAGAILITYLFVIMLATEGPTEQDSESLAEYDRSSREPVLATVFAFVLLAGMTALFARGSAELPAPAGYSPMMRLAALPGRVEASLREAGRMDPGDELVVSENTGWAVLEESGGVIMASIRTEGGDIEKVFVPEGATIQNTEGVGVTLLAEHPGSIEIAGVILLMSMLGAVVLARKKLDLDERALQAAGREGGSRAGSGGAA